MKKMVHGFGILSACVLLQAVFVSPCSAATANWRNILVGSNGFTNQYGKYIPRPTTTYSSSSSSYSSGSSSYSSTSSGNQNALKSALNMLAKQQARLIAMQKRGISTGSDARAIAAQKAVIRQQQNLVNMLAKK